MHVQCVRACAFSGVRERGACGAVPHAVAGQAAVSVKDHVQEAGVGEGVPFLGQHPLQVPDGHDGCVPLLPHPPQLMPQGLLRFAQQSVEHPPHQQPIYGGVHPAVSNPAAAPVPSSVSALHPTSLARVNG